MIPLPQCARHVKHSLAVLSGAQLGCPVFVQPHGYDWIDEKNALAAMVRLCRAAIEVTHKCECPQFAVPAEAWEAMEAAAAAFVEFGEVPT